MQLQAQTWQAVTPKEKSILQVTKPGTITGEKGAHQPGSSPTAGATWVFLPLSPKRPGLTLLCLGELTRLQPEVVWPQAKLHEY